MAVRRVIVAASMLAVLPTWTAVRGVGLACHLACGASCLTAVRYQKPALT